MKSAKWSTFDFLPCLYAIFITLKYSLCVAERVLTPSDCFPFDKVLAQNAFVKIIIFLNRFDESITFVALTKRPLFSGLILQWCRVETGHNCISSIFREVLRISFVRRTFGQLQMLLKFNSRSLQHRGKSGIQMIKPAPLTALYQHSCYTLLEVRSSHIGTVRNCRRFLSSGDNLAGSTI